MVNAGAVTLEMEDNFQKQTNRNRMYIYSPNGVQLLNIPIKHSKAAHQRIQDVKLETAFDWQKQHFKSLEAAYRTSPFFEYFEDDLMPIFTTKHTFLMDLNLQTMELVSKCLGMDFNYTSTTEYFHEVPNHEDLRHLINGKKIVTSKILKLMEELLPHQTFYRIHKSYIVNLNLIKQYVKNDGNHVLLENDVKLDVSDRNKKEFLEKLLQR
jgi:hypothetical protein